MQVPKNMSVRRVLSLLAIMILASSAITYVFMVNMGSGVYVGDETEQWYTPYGFATYIIGAYNSSHYYLQNHTGYGSDTYHGYEWIDSNLTEVEKAALGNITSGLIYLTEVPHNTSLSLGNSEMVIQSYNGIFQLYSNLGMFIIPQLASDPSTAGWGVAEEGRIWYNTGSHLFKFWNSTDATILNEDTAWQGSWNTTIIDIIQNQFSWSDNGTQTWQGTWNTTVTDIVENDFSWTNNGTSSITLNGTLPYAYVIFINSTATYMVNGSNSNIDYYSTNSSKVINFALGNGTSGQIFMREGEYNIDDELDMTATQSLLGSGGNSTFLIQTKNLEAVIRVAQVGASPSVPYGWCVRDLCIKQYGYNGHGIYAPVSSSTKQHAGNYIWNVVINRTSAGYSCIELGNIERFDIQHCMFRTYGTAIHIYDTDGTSFNWGDSSLSNCWLQLLGNNAVGLNITSSDTDFSGDITNIILVNNLDIYMINSLTGTTGVYLNHVMYMTFIGLHVENAITSLYCYDVRYSFFYGTQLWGTAAGGIGIQIDDYTHGLTFIGGYLATSGNEINDLSDPSLPATPNYPNIFRDITMDSSSSVSLRPNSHVFNCPGYSPVGVIASPTSNIGTTYIVDSGTGSIANDTEYMITNSPKTFFVGSDGTMLRTLVDGTAVFTTDEGYSLTLNPGITIEFEWSSPPTITVVGC